MIVIIAFMSHLQSSIGINKCVIMQFLASQDLIVDMILNGWNFLLKFRPKKTEKVPQETEKNRKLPQISNLGLF